MEFKKGMTNYHIKRHLDGVDKRIRSIIKDELKYKLKIKDLFFAGGCITSMLSGEHIHDYDVYFKDTRTCDEFFEEFSEWYDGPFESNAYKMFMTANAVTIKDTEKDRTYQIIFKWSGSPVPIVDRFDFHHCQLIYDPEVKKLYTPNRALRSILSRQLMVNSDCEYPLATLLRMRKFLKRGWTIDSMQVLKLVLKLAQFDLTDPVILKDQLNGVDVIYCAMLIDAMDEMRDTSADALINEIDKLTE